MDPNGNVRLPNRGLARYAPPNPADAVKGIGARVQAAVAEGAPKETAKGIGRGVIGTAKNVAANVKSFVGKATKMSPAALMTYSGDAGAGSDMAGREYLTSPKVRDEYQAYVTELGLKRDMNAKMREGYEAQQGEFVPPTYTSTMSTPAPPESAGEEALMDWHNTLQQQQEQYGAFNVDPELARPQGGGEPSYFDVPDTDPFIAQWAADREAAGAEAAASVAAEVPAEAPVAANPDNRPGNYFGDDYLQNIKSPGLRDTIAMDQFRTNREGVGMDPTELARLKKIPEAKLNAQYVERDRRALERNVHGTRRSADIASWLASRDPNERATEYADRTGAVAEQAAGSFDTFNQNQDALNQTRITANAKAASDAAAADADAGMRAADRNSMIAMYSDSLAASMNPGGKPEYRKEASQRYNDTLNQFFTPGVRDALGNEPGAMEQFAKAATSYAAIQSVIPEVTSTLGMGGTHWNVGSPSELLASMAYLQNVWNNKPETPLDNMGLEGVTLGELKEGLKDKGKLSNFVGQQLGAGDFSGIEAEVKRGEQYQNTVNADVAQGMNREISQGRKELENRSIVPGGA